MNTQHTPGKWMTLADCQFGTESTKIMCGTAIVAVCYGSNHVNDARLIAAAPDLLNALQMLADVDFGACEWRGEAEIAAIQARAAISKATGEIT